MGFGSRGPARRHHSERSGVPRCPVDRRRRSAQHCAGRRTNPGRLAAPCAVYGRSAAPATRTPRQCGHIAELSATGALTARAATPSPRRPPGSRRQPHHPRRSRRGHHVGDHRTRARPTQFTCEDRHHLARDLGCQPLYARKQPQPPAGRAGARHSSTALTPSGSRRLARGRGVRSAGCGGPTSSTSQAWRDGAFTSRHLLTAVGAWGYGRTRAGPTVAGAEVTGSEITERADTSITLLGKPGIG